MMSQNKQDPKALAMDQIATINAVEGFDPTPLAVDYTDFDSGTVSKRLPVMTQLAWFRLRYPDGRLTIAVKEANGGFVAKVRVYKDYKDGDDQFLSEAEAFRAYNPQKPTVSPREWAQTAAIGIALRNAGFGLQFHAAGDSFDWNVENELAGRQEAMSAPPFIAPDAAASIPATPPAQLAQSGPQQQPQQAAAEPAAPPSAPAQPPEGPLEQAMKMPCPIAKYKDKTLGDLMMLDPGALAYIAKSEKYDPAVVAGAVLICEHAVQKAG